MLISSLYFKSLQEEGLLFTDFYSNGWTSDQAMSSIFSSFPVFPYVAIINQLDKARKLPSINESLNDYHSSYFFGGQLTYGNIKGYLLANDFDLVKDKNAIPYDLSKADAQRVVLEYCNNGLEASIIHPVNIFGPYDYKVGLGTEGLLDLANGKTPRLPNWGYNYVDVRDLSKTAISAIEKGRKGQNYLVAGEYRSFIELGQMIGEALGKDIVKGSIPGFLAYLLVPFSYINSVRNGKPSTRTLDTIHTGKTGNKLVPSTLAREELNHSPRPIMETVIDFVKFYSDRGLIKI